MPFLAYALDMDADPLTQVERAQTLIEKGPVTAVAAFFALAFFAVLYLILRTKDKHQMDQGRLQVAQAQEIARLTEKHGDEMRDLYAQERERAIAHEVTMTNFLEMASDIRFIAFEMQRVKNMRDRKRRPTGEFEVVPEGDETK